MASNRPSVPAHMKLATAVDLPIDIVRDILEHAARVNLSNDPSYAASLQLICASARDWLMPVLFFVFIVICPIEGGPPKQSFRVYGELRQSPDARPRTHVKHIIFIGGTGRYVDYTDQVEHCTTWELESILLATHQHMNSVRRSNLAPRQVLMLRDFYPIQTALSFAQWNLAPPNEWESLVRLRQVEQIECSCVITAPGQAAPEGAVSGAPWGRLLPIFHFMKRRNWSRSIATPVVIRLRLALPSLAAIPVGVNLISTMLQFPGVKVLIRMSSDDSSRSASDLAVEFLEALRLSDDIGGNPVKRALVAFLIDALPPPKNAREYAYQLRNGIRQWEAGTAL